MYETKVWSELDRHIIEKLTSVENGMRICQLKVPSRKDIRKGFYSNRRSLQLIKKDPEKKTKRKFDLKKIDYQSNTRG